MLALTPHVRERVLNIPCQFSNYGGEFTANIIYDRDGPDSTLVVAERFCDETVIRGSTLLRTRCIQNTLTLIRDRIAHLDKAAA